MPAHMKVMHRGAYLQPWQPPEIPLYGLGDWRGAIAQAIAEKELDRLTDAVLGIQDSLVEAIEARNGVLSGYVQAKRIFEEQQKLFGSPMIGMLPNFRLIPAVLAFGTAQKGVKLFARQVQTLQVLDVVFSMISTELHRGGLYQDEDAVNQTLRQIRKFASDTDTLFANVPEYKATKLKIAETFKAELPQWRVGQTDYADPRWFAAFVKAADKVIPLPGRPAAPSEMAVAGMSGLGNPALPVLIVALIWVVGIISFTVALTKTLARLIPDQNSKAETAKQILLAAEDRKRKVETEMRAQGKTEAEIRGRIATIDEETKRAVSEIPEPPFPFGFILAPLGVAAGGYVLLKAFGVI